MTGRDLITLNLVDRHPPSADLEENTSTSWIGASNEDLFTDPYDCTRPKRFRWLCLSLAFQTLVVGLWILHSVTAESELPAPRFVKTFRALAPTTAPPPPPPSAAVPASPMSVASKRPVVAPPMRLAELVASAIPVEPFDIAEFTGFGFDERVEGGVPGDVIGGWVGGLGGTPAPKEPEPTIYVVRGKLERPEKLVHIDPVYPAIATATRVEGLVILEATIDGEGNVGKLRVLRSIPLLDAAAVDAVKRWKYEPTVIGGTPVSVLMTVTVKFALA